MRIPVEVGRGEQLPPAHTSSDLPRLGETKKIKAKGNFYTSPPVLLRRLEPRWPAGVPPAPPKAPGPPRDAGGDAVRQLRGPAVPGLSSPPPPTHPPAPRNQISLLSGTAATPRLPRQEQVCRRVLKDDRRSAGVPEESRSLVGNLPQSVGRGISCLPAAGNLLPKRGEHPTALHNYASSTSTSNCLQLVFCSFSSPEILSVNLYRQKKF